MLCKYLVLVLSDGYFASSLSWYLFPTGTLTGTLFLTRFDQQLYRHFDRNFASTLGVRQVLCRYLGSTKGFLLVLCNITTTSPSKSTCLVESYSHTFLSRAPPVPVRYMESIFNELGVKAMFPRFDIARAGGRSPVVVCRDFLRHLIHLTCVRALTHMCVCVAQELAMIFDLGRALNVPLFAIGKRRRRPGGHCLGTRSQWMLFDVSFGLFLVQACVDPQWDIYTSVLGNLRGHQCRNSQRGDNWYNGRLFLFLP